MALYNEMIDHFMSEIDSSAPAPLPLESTAPPISDAAKLHVFDSIIDHAKDVFGPTGGMVVTYNVDTSENKVFKKTKDGHEFITELNFIHRWANTLLANIIGKTGYITSHKTKDVSRDGTTSFALISSAISKFMVMQKMTDPSIVEGVPSTIINSILDVFIEEGAKLVDELKVKIWDEETCSYIGKGKEYALNCIKTTVDRDLVVYSAFEKLINTCVDEGINMMDALIQREELSTGEAKVEFKLVSGVKTSVRSITEELAAAIDKRKTAFFILDGFIDLPNIRLFERDFDWFLNQLGNIRDSEGWLFDPDGKHKLGQPIFLVTRTPDHIVEYYKRLAIKGVFMNIPGHPNGGYTIKPTFLLANDVDYDAPFYEDLISVFKESFIDLNMMEKYINCTRNSEEFDQEQRRWKPTTSKTGVEIRNLFPLFHSDGIRTLITRPIWALNGEKRVIEVPGSANRYETPMVVEVFGEDGKIKADRANLMNVFGDISYDGKNMYIHPFTEEVTTRAQEKRKALTDLFNAYKHTSTEENRIPQRRDCFSSVTIVPEIQWRDEGELSNIMALLDDAIGVFASIHKHGVIGGSNSFFLKYTSLYFSRVNTVLNNQMSLMSTEAKDKYMKFTSAIMDSVVMAYRFIYQFLETDEEVLRMYGFIGMQELDDESVLETWDIVRKTWGTDVIEAAKTTRDIIVNSLGILKDTLLIKRLRLSGQLPLVQRDLTSLGLESNSKPIHPMNLEYCKEETKENFLNRLRKIGG